MRAWFVIFKLVKPWKVIFWVVVYLFFGLRRLFTKKEPHWSFLSVLFSLPKHEKIVERSCFFTLVKVFESTFMQLFSLFQIVWTNYEKDSECFHLCFILVKVISKWDRVSVYKFRTRKIMEWCWVILLLFMLIKGFDKASLRYRVMTFLDRMN